MESAAQAIEPFFLSQALAKSARLRIGQMNRTEHNGVIREIGRYEINIEDKGAVTTVLKQDISFITAQPGILAISADQPESQPASAALSAKPNIQQEFLSKAVQERHLLTIFLLTGQRIKATIEAFDNFTLLVREGDMQHLIYKHAISTINR